MRNWTDWLKDNVDELKGNPSVKVSELLRDIIDKRDDTFGWTATHGFAASSESLGMDVMNALLDFLRQSNLESQLVTKDNDGDFPVQSAIRSKAPKEFIECLIAVKDIKGLLCSQNRKTHSPLFTAFDESHWDAVEVLLGKCIECNQLSELTGVKAIDEKQSTLLHKAFERGNAEYFKRFLRVCSSKGIVGEELTAAVLVSNRRKVTPWYYAVRLLNIEALTTVVNSIEEYELDINCLFTEKATRSTMLHEAYRSHKQSFYLLLKQHCDTEQRDNQGFRPHERDRQLAEQASEGRPRSGSVSSTESYEPTVEFSSAMSNSSA